MHFAPGASLTDAMLAGFPFAFTIDFQPGRVNHDVEWLVLAAARQRNRQPFGASAERTITRDGQMGRHQVEHGLGKTLGLAQRQGEDRFQGQQRLDR